jgi:hypothetical protein
MEVEKLPPVYMPEYLSITIAPEFPALAGNVTVVMAYPPGGIFTSD